jgi:hypothetical protein
MKFGSRMQVRFKPRTGANWNLRRRKFWYSFLSICVLLTFEGFVDSALGVAQQARENAASGRVALTVRPEANAGSQSSALLMSAYVLGHVANIDLTKRAAIDFSSPSLPSGYSFLDQIYIAPKSHVFSVAAVDGQRPTRSEPTRSGLAAILCPETWAVSSVR